MLDLDPTACIVHGRQELGQVSDRLSCTRKEGNAMRLLKLKPAVGPCGENRGRRGGAMTGRGENSRVKASQSTSTISA